MKFVVLLIAISTFAGCAFNEKSVVKATGDTVQFAGPITTESAAQFVSLVKHAPVRRLVIHSGGGDVIGALDMADVIYEHGIDVEVVGRCFSSCANYIFPAGRHKIISGDGVVGWHGNMTHLLYLNEHGEFAMTRKEFSVIQRLAVREKAFYKKIGVNGFIDWFGKLPPYDVHNIYLLSKSDMALFGLKNLQVPKDYLDTKLYRFNLFGTDQVRFIHVDWPAVRAKEGEIRADLVKSGLLVQLKGTEGINNNQL